MADSPNKAHRWRFHRLGGFDQVRIESGADICHLPELDQKLWAAQRPTSGLSLTATLTARHRWGWTHPCT